ncbi:phage tail spike protein [Staphylococcus xylosus]|uniref:phage tail spike protein n=1 Tax=Staphylococcus xylosus TaxID=1288 RepID=UPI001CDD32D9|nr:phage tail spike protein [Staphylococcus xylosus]UBV41089.1 phage tail protein [Staphylococcus xylosus]
MEITDLKGNTYPLDAVVEHEVDLQSNERIDLDIHYTENNAEFLKQNDDLKMWLITFDNKDYRIFQSNINTQGNRYMVSVTARLYILDWLTSQRLYKRVDASLTTTEAFNLVFSDSPFTYVIVDAASSESFEGLGEGATLLEVFQKLIDRYGYEVNIVGNAVYLEFQMGNDTNFEYRYQLNASNITKEVDASEMYTYIKGYGNYDDESDDDTPIEERAKLIPEPYISPLAEIIGIRHAPPIKDGRMTKEKTLKEAMKKVVDDSVQITFSADIQDMSNQGYDYQNTSIGDRIFLVDERIGLDKEIRISKIQRTFNAEGVMTKMAVTFGGQNMSDAHSSSTNQAITDIQDIINGRKRIPFPALDIVSQSMVSKIKATTSEIEYDSNGQHFIEKSKPNNIMTLNSSGLLLSTDGGRTAKTAITAEGIVANAITTGTLNANNIRIFGGGDDKNVTIQKDELRLSGTFSRTWQGNTTVDNIFTSMKNGYLRFRNNETDSSIYLSHFGFSTFRDQFGDYVGSEGRASGTIMFWDKSFSPSGANGITINSYGGVAALTSSKNRTMIGSRLSVNLQSAESAIMFQPKMEQAPDTGFVMNTSNSGGNIPNGYLMYGGIRGEQVNYSAGLRFERQRPHVSVVNPNFATGGETVIEAGQGEFNTVARRQGNQYLNVVHAQLFKVGSDGKDRVASQTIYNRTYSASANVHVTSYGTLGRATSASKYKLSIEKQFKNEEEQIKHSNSILNLDMKSWFDKEESEITAKECENNECFSADAFQLKRHVGLVAEDIEKIGLEEHVVYDEDGEIEGIEYDRLWVHLIPIIKKQQKQIEKLEEIMNE